MQIPAELVDRIQRLAAQHKDLHALLGERLFDEFAIARSLALRRKLEGGAFDRAREVCVGHNLRHAVPVNPQRHYLHLAADFLAGELDSLPDRCVYLLLNNDIGKQLPRYLELVQRRPQCLFVVWDWDSQHWLQMACTLAAASDFYVPSTSENLYTLAHFNPQLLGPAFAAVNQWSRDFIVEHMALLLEPRRDEPFGPHVHYEGFDRRNRALTTLQRSFAGIGFTDHGYQQKSELDNLADWARHKAHWIVPVLGGVPIRVYNCLATGGIAVVPAHYRCMPERLLLGDEVLYYDVIDLVDPQAVQRQAVQRFDAEGPAGVVRRVGAALDRQHIDGRAESVLAALDDALARLARGSREDRLGYLMAR